MEPWTADEHGATLWRCFFLGPGCCRGFQDGLVLRTVLLRLRTNQQASCSSGSSARVPVPATQPRDGRQRSRPTAQSNPKPRIDQQPLPERWPLGALWIMTVRFGRVHWQAILGPGVSCARSLHSGPFSRTSLLRCRTISWHCLLIHSLSCAFEPLLLHVFLCLYLCLVFCFQHL